MWVVYRKSDRAVVGTSAVSERDLPKNDAIAEVARGRGNKGTLEGYDAVQITDVGEAMATISAPIDQIAIEEPSKGKLRAVVRRREPAFLVLRSDAPDVHEVDGIPEIAADGTSFTTITIQKVTRGEPQTAKSDDDTLYLRTTAGTIQSADGKQEIAKLKLERGKASFRLASEKARRVATVSVFNGDDTLENASIQIEFI